MNAVADRRRRGAAQGLAFGLVIVVMTAAVLADGAARAQEMGATILKEGKIKENLLLAGETVTVDADVTGDVTAMGREVVVRGVVNGDVIATGANIEAEGHILGDLRAIAGSVDVIGTVNGDINSFAASATVHAASTVNGNASLAGHDVTILGHIGRNLKVSARRVVIGGRIDGDVDLKAHTVVVRPGAKIAGNFNYQSDNEADIAPDVKIGGDLTFTQSNRAYYTMSRVFAFAGGFGAVMFLGVILLGAAVVSLFPNFFVTAAQSIRQLPWQTAGVGIVVLIVTPAAIAILFSTVIGIPIALALAGVYLAAVVLGYLVAAVFIGRYVAHMFGRSWDESALGRIAAAAVGLIILAIVLLIPVVGAVAIAASLIFGTGTVAWTIVKGRKSAA